MIIDFSRTLIRASCMGNLFVPPKDKEAKQKGELSVTAKQSLIKVYIQERWARRKEVVVKQMEKGKLAEESAITLLSRVDKKFYVKNQERKSNEYSTGHADIIYAQEIVIDTKASWDAETFLPQVMDPLDRSYNVQLQVYMWLWQLELAKLSYCLVNTPESLIQNERRKLLYSMDVISDESPEYKSALVELERNMIFDDIPEKERVFSHIVPRDEELIKQIPEKVEKARKFLAWFQERHLNHNNKNVNPLKLITA